LSRFDSTSPADFVLGSTVDSSSQAAAESPHQREHVRPELQHAGHISPTALSIHASHSISDDPCSPEVTSIVMDGGIFQGMRGVAALWSEEAVESGKCSSIGIQGLGKASRPSHTVKQQ